MQIPLHCEKKVWPIIFCLFLLTHSVFGDIDLSDAKTIYPTYGHQIIEFTIPDHVQAFDILNKKFAVDYYKELTNIDGPLKTKLDEIKKEHSCSDYNPRSLQGELSPMCDDNTVLWSLGRGGWDEAFAAYRTFVTWTDYGSGCFERVVLSVQFDVSVSEEKIYSGTSTAYVVTVNVDFDGFKSYED